MPASGASRSKTSYISDKSCRIKFSFSESVTSIFDTNPFHRGPPLNSFLLTPHGTYSAGRRLLDRFHAFDNHHATVMLFLRCPGAASHVFYDAGLLHAQLDSGGEHGSRTAFPAEAPR